ncbi:MAG: citrate synthase, partial [Pseudomonadota bacterium]
SFVQVLYLLYRGELPSKDQEKLLESLMIALINPGPRHGATRAAMNAGVGKTLPVHILPIATSVLGGDYLGGGEIEPAIRFLRKHTNKDPALIAAQLLEADSLKDESIAPGFGRRYGGIDIMTCSLADKLCQLRAASDGLHWGAAFSAELNKHGMGWLPTGLAAAVFTDLGFQPKYGGPLFQLIGAPGLIAHGMELANKPFTAMPFVPDENYVIED